MQVRYIITQIIIPGLMYGSNVCGEGADGEGIPLVAEAIFDTFKT